MLDPIPARPPQSLKPDAEMVNNVWYNSLPRREQEVLLFHLATHNSDEKDALQRCTLGVLSLEHWEVTSGWIRWHAACDMWHVVGGRRRVHKANNTSCVHALTLPSLGHPSHAPCAMLCHAHPLNASLAPSPLESPLSNFNLLGELPGSSLCVRVASVRRI